MLSPRTSGRAEIRSWVKVSHTAWAAPPCPKRPPVRERSAHALGLPVPEFISLLLLNDVVRRLRW